MVHETLKKSSSVGSLLFMCGLSFYVFLFEFNYSKLYNRAESHLLFSPQSLRDAFARLSFKSLLFFICLKFP